MNGAGCPPQKLSGKAEARPERGENEANQNRRVNNFIEDETMFQVNEGQDKEEASIDRQHQKFNAETVAQRDSGEEQAC